MLDKIGVCSHCHKDAWVLRGAQEPIVSVACMACGAVEWIAVLGADSVSQLTHEDG